jgi:hypothetical protein
MMDDSLTLFVQCRLIKSAAKRPTKLSQVLQRRARHKGKGLWRDRKTHEREKDK